PGAGILREDAVVQRRPGPRIDAAEQRDEALGCWSRKLQADAALGKEASRFGSFGGDGHDAEAAALIESVRQQPARIQAILEVVDCPGEVYVAVDGGEVLRIPVRAGKTYVRLGSDQTVEIVELDIGRASAQDDFE